jgi:single-strand DNA-binding protein
MEYLELSMNQAILIGHLTANPESRYFASGANVTHFRIAVDRPKPRENQPQTDFFHCQAWGKLGDIISEFTRIGHQVAVSGSIHIESYDYEGQLRWKTYIKAVRFSGTESHNVRFLTSKAEATRLTETREATAA